MPDPRQQDTTRELRTPAQVSAQVSAQASGHVSAQQREQADPTERSQPIPLIAAIITAGVLLFGVGYIFLAQAPGAPEFGDHRTLADLRGAAPPAAGAVANGAQLFSAQCVACHQASGKGLPGVFPPLDGSEWVVGEPRTLANILLHGIDGEITVAGTVYKGNMPAFRQLTDAELAALASHVRSQWSNRAQPIAAATFAQERLANPRSTPFAGGAELLALGKKAP